MLQVCPQCPQWGCGNRLLLPSGRVTKPSPLWLLWNHPWNAISYGITSRKGMPHPKGLCWALMATLVRGFLDKGTPPDEVLDEIWRPTLQGWEDFLGLNADGKGSWISKGERFLKYSFVSPPFLKACVLGRPGLASHQHFNDHRHNHPGHSFYSRNCGVPHNSGLPSSSCAISCSSDRGNQSHPPPRGAAPVSAALLRLGTAFCASPSCQNRKDTLL